MTLSELIDAFLAWNERHRKPPTVNFYRQRLRLFRKKFGSRRISSLKSLEIDEYLSVAGQGMSDSTKHHNAVALTSLQNFARREKLMKEKWFEHLDKPRIGRRERIPSGEEIQLLLEKARPDFRSIYVGLCQSGARPGELCRAAIADVDWAKGAIVLREHKTAGKTGKPRVISIGKEFEATLRAAIGDRLGGRVFLTHRGNPWTVDGLSGTFRRLRDAAGIDKALKLYSARHRYGTELIRAGVPIADVALLMGHENVATTQIYVHRDATELRASVDRLPSIPNPGPPPEKAA